jgi:hypothetical protein
MRETTRQIQQIKDKQEKLRSNELATEEADKSKGTMAPRQRPQGGNDAKKRRRHRDHKV